MLTALRKKQDRKVEQAAATRSSFLISSYSVDRTTKASRDTPKLFCWFTGCLADGCLYFTLSEEGCLLPYILNSTVPVPDRVCSLLELEGHEHGVDCGHELVQHDDHWDFLVSMT